MSSVQVQLDITERIAKMIGSIQSKLPTDAVKNLCKAETNSQRIRVTLEYRDTFCSELQIQEQFNDKSTCESEELRSSGNALFRAKKYTEALRNYNGSVCYAPFPKSQNGLGNNALAYAFANRSALLQRMKRYDLCIRDIEHSLRFGYDESLQYKLFERQARCHLDLGQGERATTAAEKAQNSLSLAKLGEEELGKWQQTIHGLEERCRKARTQEKSIPSSHLEEEIWDDTDQGELIHCNSKSSKNNSGQYLKAEFSSKLGRYYAAAKDVDVGQSLMEEEPYAAILLPELYTSHCNHCCLRIVAAFPCRQCATIAYCSAKCERRAWKQYHQLECRYSGWLGSPCLGKLGHLALRAAIVMGSCTAHQEEVGNLTPRDSVEQREQEQHVLDGCPGVLKLVTHETDRDFQANLDMVIIAVIVHGILEAARLQCGLETGPSGEAVVLERLLQMIQAVQCNGICIQDMDNISQFDNNTPQDIGLGLYPRLSIFNHACNASCELLTTGARATARAMTNIKSGSEITSSYGPVYYLHTKNERAAVLQRDYFFKCCCQACSEDWPLFEGLQTSHPEFKCPDCDRQLQRVGAQQLHMACGQCGESLDLCQAAAELAASHDMYTTSLQQAKAGKVNQALPGLQVHQSLMQAMLCQPWREMCSCQATIRQCYRILAARESATLTLNGGF